ncbi:bacitracin non-ribosomal peptide synthetase BacC [Bacillus paralicheniformis]|uniref:bacitracin non-ribosomal peptide synthetase BacC n=1 Tax=Bacillus paralicheniformis TaxID=1648923 RepID=UPI00298CBEA3|nr:bacitracin non-ribosomal peptide synthetase BacC [Bacillus paralicheniformis]MDW6053303.1 bacitracin non-ribosomal peptide synthetase BacC [Bacillus paralicheniformis]
MKTKVEKIYPLSNMQKGMLFHAMKDEASHAYFEQFIIELKGDVDERMFEESLNEVMKRHEILRASFHHRLDEPLHVIIKDRHMKFDYLDIRGRHEQDGVLESYLAEDRQKGFNLAKDTLMRACLIRTSDDSYQFVWTYHHILLDGWCLGIILDELLTIYEMKRKGQHHQLEDPRPYSDYIKWLEDQDKEEAQSYWESYLSGYDQKNSLPKLRTPSETGFKRREKTIECSKELTNRLIKLANQNHVTINTVLQSIWGVILAKYNNSEDVVFGTVVSGRDAEVEGIETMVGVFINTIPTRIRLGKDKLFKDVLRQTQADALESSRYNYMNLAEVQALSELKNDLIDHVMVFENYAVDQKAFEEKNDVGFEMVNVSGEEQTNYHFSISAALDDQLKLLFIYDENVYDDTIIETLEKHIITVAEQVAEDEAQTLQDINLVSKEEQQRILDTFNDTKTDYPKDKPLHELFEEQAMKTPDQTALVFGAQRMTYRELNKKANQTARLLREKGIGRGSIAAIIADRSFEMIIGIIGILKAGGTYLPIDPETPRDRIDYMLENSGAALLVTTDSLLQPFDIRTVDLRSDELHLLGEENLPRVNSSSDTAYIVYTSGSTGTPKGVVIPHYSAARVVQNTNYIDITEDDAILQLSNYSFDGSVFDIFGALLNGASLVLIEKETVLNTHELAEVIEKERVSVMFITTALFNTLADINIGCLAKLRKILFGGERASIPHVRKVLNHVGRDKLIHVYGPTESTVYATYYFINEIDEKADTIPIGSPLANTSVLIMDEAGKLVPIGVPGELCIAGDGLSTGYLNREELTAEKFIPHPFIPGERLYKTGDLAKWLPDGNIEFIGRIDHQVKIRGFRIELGEIESRLEMHEDINETIVTVREDGENRSYICAYITAKREISLDELKGFLGEKLPDYMIPAYFVNMDKLPLTKNGKVDRKALPEPDRTMGAESEYEAPRNETEEKLAAIWRDILKVEKAGINDHFFELGGHSLKAAAMAARIRKELKAEIPLGQIFKTPTIKGLGEYIRSTKDSVDSSIKKVEEKEYYRLSSAQKRLYILGQIEGSGLSYNIPFTMKVKGSFDIRRFENALQIVIQRHEALRTSFLMADGEPVQKIEKEVDFSIKSSEIESLSIQEIIKQFVRPFDLKKAPLFRTEVVKVDDEEHIILFDMHHIISDGASMGVLTKEICDLYGGKELEPLSLQYKDYSEWQRDFYQKDEMKRQKEYWLNIFKGEIPVLNMPTDYPRPQMHSVEGDRIGFAIDGELTKKLKRIAKNNGATMYMLLLAAYTVLLRTYSGQEDLIIGTPIQGRKHHELKHVIGMFVNTLAMRNHPKGDKTFAEFLQDVKETALKAYENQDYQFDDLVEQLDLERDMSRNPLFDTMFVLQNLEKADAEIEGLTFEPFESDIHISKFDLTLSAIEKDSKIEFDLEYCTKLFKRETVERMAAHFVRALEDISNRPDKRLDQIEAMSEDEKNTLLYRFNDTKTDAPTDKTICRLFAERAETSPDQTAVVFEDQKLTYRQLHERSNQLARFLRDKGVKPDTAVGIMVDRSPEMIIGLLGILKAGGAYLPLDPAYPEDRIKYILGDSQTKFLLSEEALIKKRSFIKEAGMINIDIHDKQIAALDAAQLETVSHSGDLAYIIYTSGSTGKPKGVLIEQKGLSNLVSAVVKLMHLNTDSRVIQFASLSFDASAFEIFPALAAGAALVLGRQEEMMPGQPLTSFLRQYDITHATLPPTVLNVLDEFRLENLKVIVSAGSACTEELAKRWFGNRLFINAYGPTETTVCATAGVYGGSGRPHIGSPIDNTNVYVLDQNQKPVPTGVVGELCVGGISLARGYLNRPELTAEKFISHPFVSGERLYRTGDLARWLPGGHLEFLGRIDHQVKIRGYRIELGEIENQLLKLDKIDEAAVIARKDDDNSDYLCAYIVSKEDWTSTELSEWLEKELPHYMIPAYFVRLDKLPLTANDKVDRKALPAPDRHVATGAEYEAPRDDTEAKLVDIWRDVLGAGDIGISHHFFAAGGDSIKALQIVSRLSRLGLKLEMKDLFANPRIKDLSKYVKKQSQRQNANTIVTGHAELTPIQKWYFTNNKEELDHFNQSFVLFRKGGFDESCVKKTFNKIMEQHDALRMIYEEKGGDFIQYNRSFQEDLFDLDVYDVRGLDRQAEKVYELATSIQKQTSIRKGKLVHLGIFRADEGDHLLIVIHHLVVDGVSWRILFEDFETLYSQALKGQTLEIGYKTDSYQEFARRLKAYARSRTLLKEAKYWRNVAKARVRFIPPKNILKEDVYENSTTLSIKLGKEATADLLRNTNRAYNTEINDILLTALLTGAKDITGENKLKVMMEGHGREDILEGVDITRTIGWFTTMYPVLLDAGEEKALSQHIKMVKETLRKIPNKGIGYGLLKYMAEDPDFINEEKARISFNYLGEIDADMNRGEFSGSSFSEGESIGGKIARSHSIEINAIVIHHELVIHTTFNQMEYEKDTISRLNHQLKERLEQIIKHCTQQTESERTPSDYGDTNISLDELEEIKGRYRGVIEKIYPLANMQKGMLFHAIEDHTSDAYFQQTIMDIEGYVDPAILEASFNDIMKRHEILRASYEYEIVEEPRQIIIENRSIDFTYFNIAKSSAQQQEMFIERLINEDRKKGFDLSRDVLMRVYLLKTAERSYRLVWSHHHILLDGWCLGIIMRELFVIYENRMNGKASPLKETKPYSDYIKWLERQDQEEGRQYWREYLKGYEEQAQLPTLTKRKKSSLYDRREKVIHLSKQLTKQLKALAAKNSVTLHTVIQTIWGLMLTKYNKIDDVVFGTVVSGREANVDGIEDMIGLFINTIPTRIRFNEQARFNECLQKVQEDAIQSNRYNYMNLAEVQALSSLKKDLIDHILVFENYETDEQDFEESQMKTGFKVNEISAAEQSNYSFSMSVTPGEELTLVLTYDGNVYDRDIINNIEGHIKRVAEQVTANENRKIAEIDMLAEEERKTLLYEFNRTNADYPRNKTIHQLFEEQAERTPGHTAVVFEKEKLSYKALNERSNQLAGLLREKGVKPDMIVGVMAERSVEMIVGMLAVLKAGGAYLPIDPEYPEDRIRYMIEDSGISILLKKADKQIDVDLTCIDMNEKGLTKDKATENLEHTSGSSDMAYVIYTSGSTGKPKGVMVNHQSIVNTLYWRKQSYGYSTADATLQVPSFSFDSSVEDIFTTLISGAKLVLIRDLRMNPREIIGALRTHKATNLLAVPSFYLSLLDTIEQPLEDLRFITVAGEGFNESLIRQHFEKLPNVKLFNEYGPTENSVCSTRGELQKDDEKVVIGRPISNHKAYILNHNQQLLPLGTPGELCLSGEGLARGYLNRPDLTLGKFVPNPFVPGENMYRTGDLARFLPDGQIEYLGRIDHQVKIRGFRIELSEIENQLLKIEGIDAAAVMAREDQAGGKYLCAYIVADKTAGVADVRKCLLKELPDYMVPSYFVKLDQLPLTANGKIDRKALPEPSGTISEATYEAPRNRTEEKLVSIWEDVLGIENIGISHNFFELGGHSLKAAALTAKLHKEMKIEVPLRQIFETPTIKDIGDFIESMKESPYASITQAEEKEYYALSSAQRRLYILNQIEPGGLSYNMPFAMKIAGDFDVDRFEDAFRQLIERHEALRTAFVVVDGEPVQKIEKEVDFKVKYGRLGQDRLEEKIKAFIKPFALEKAPLLRVEVLKASGDEHVLMFDMHHIISDGVSMAIFTRELAELYEGKTLQPLTIQYKDFSEWQKLFYQKDEIKRQEDYWLNVFQGEVPVLNLPADEKRPQKRSIEGDIVQFEIDGETSAMLNKLAKENGATMYMLLLAGYTTLLAKYTGQEDIVVGSPIAGRHHSDLKHVIGVFINTLAMRNHPIGDMPFADYLKEVKETALKAYENQDYPFDELVEKLDVKRDMSRHPLFDTMLVLQNFDGDEADIDGLIFQPLQTEVNISKFDLTLTAAETNEGIQCVFNYSTKLFKRSTIERMAGHLINILKEAANDPQMPLSDVNMLSDEEMRVLRDQNQGQQTDYPKDQTVHQLFEHQAGKSPEQTAVVFADEKLTYRELNEKANQLARLLRDKGASAGAPVAIMIEPSLEMIISMLAVLKAGAAYVPIESEQLAKRTNEILSDSRAAILLVKGSVKENVAFAGEIVNVADGLIDAKAASNLSASGAADQNAYIIYTSGSTGKPKGVFIRHGNVVNYTAWFMKEAGLTENDKAMLVSSYAFDLGYTSIFSALLSGSELHIARKECYTNAHRALKYIKENGITYIKLTPSLFNIFVNDPGFSAEKPCASLRLVVLGGEMINTRDVETFYNQYPDHVVMNHYGPTETTIGSVFKVIDPEHLNSFKEYPVIGTPIHNTNVYVLDENMKLLPEGVYGELCIAGAGVTGGYVNKPDITKEKFVENPFAPHTKMYRTGDLARRLSDGNIELAGRMDSQVKVRGYRIEPEEIKNRLLAHDDIKEAFIAAREDHKGAKQLCAYFTANAELPFEDIRTYLMRELPEYMIPSSFVQIEKMPLSANGKIDTTALPEPQPGKETEYEPPRNETEEKLVQIWEDVLGIDKIGITHHFFAAGGDSIKALQMISRLSREGLSLEMKDLFANPQIKSLSRYVKAETDKSASYETVEGEVLLTPIQQEYFSLNKTDRNHYNHAVILYRKNGFDESIVKRVFREIIQHHDALRTVFREEGGKIIQYNRGPGKKLFDLFVYDVSSENDQPQKVYQLATELQQSIDIKTGPLVKLALFKTNNGDHLLIIIHHLVVDGISWRILFEDLALGYSQLSNGEKVEFYPKTASYQEYAHHITEYSKTEKLLGEKQYWLKAVCEDVKFLEMNEDAGVFKVEDSKTFSTELEKEETARLLRETNQAYRTEINDLLIAALLVAARDMTGQNKLRITLEGHGREQVADGIDISRTVGWFTSKYPVFIDLGQETDMSRTIKMVKEHLRNVPNKGIGYGILKYLTRDSEIAKGATSPILFNYLGQLDEDINSGEFSSSHLSPGEAAGKGITRENPLEINAVVFRGQLAIQTTYNTRAYSEDVVRTFAQKYKEALKAVIRHCAEREETEKTPSDYGDKGISLDQLEEIKLKYKGMEIEKIYPLANMQRGMLFHALEDKESQAYFEQMAIDMKGLIDERLFAETFNDIMERHEILRASIEYEITDEPRNVIIKDRKINLDYHDLRKQSPAEREQVIQTYRKADREKGFCLNSEPLIRAALMRTEDDSYTFIWTNHHILLDGWSRGIIMGELFQMYHMKEGGQKHRLEEARPYSDYIGWLEQQDKEAPKAYWKNYLSGFTEKSPISVLASSSGHAKYKRKEAVIEFPQQLTGRITELASRNNVTLHTVLQCIWGMLLARYNQTDDVVFGTVISGRDAQVAGIEKMVGLFINTVPTRIRLEKSQSFKELIKSVQEQALEGRTYHDMNLSEVQSLSELKRELLDHILIFENYAVDQSAFETSGKRGAGFIFEEIHAEEQTNYGFNIVAVPGERLVIKLTYDGNIYHDHIIAGIKGHLQQVMEQVVQNEDQSLNDITVLSEAERNRLLYEWNDTKAEYPNQTIHRLFEEQAEKTPELAAVVSGNDKLTYRELNEKSNQLARYLRDKGVKEDTIVAIMAERSPEMVVGIMGILKAGGAYLPIDPDYPEERIKYMLEDSGAAIILVDHKQDLGILHQEAVELTGDFSSYPADNLEPAGNTDSLAYIIYTSGSTGKPKGVMIRQRGLVNYITWAARVYVQGEQLDFALYSSIAFDLTVTSIFTPLISGNRVIVYHHSRDGEPLIRKVFRDQKAGIVKLTPSHLSLVKDMGASGSSIKRLIVGGEDLKTELAKEITERFHHNIEIYNEYGPTETVVGCMIYQYDAGRDRQVSVPIGKPASNVQLYILDERQEVQPVGIAGELYISGDGVAKGYLNKPELTSEKFLPNPFLPGERMYRTGDLARMRPDGHIEYLGRIDHQVKIRGYRIELGEIEHQLLRHSDIKEAAVAAKTDQSNDQVLCAYVVSERDITQEDIKAFLVKELPEYMVPSYLLKLDELPLTPNGKVDLKALPEPDRSAGALLEYEPPRHELEEKMAAIWEDILNIELIGINANIFDIGANSLNIMSFVSRLYAELGFRVPFKDIFSKPTIKELSDFLKHAQDLLKDYTDDCMQLTRAEEGGKNLFCFPPAASMGIAYMGLAKYLKQHSVYSFNFIPSANRVRKYADIIKNIQGEGPYTLIGYSSGGILAFDVAKELNRQGYEVEDLIIIDSKYRTKAEKHQFTEEEYREEISKTFELEKYRDAEKLLSDYLVDLVMKSYVYIQNTVTTGAIDGHISYIKSSDNQRDENMMMWEKAASKTFTVVQGAGTHMQMISKSHPDILERNARLIHDIINKTVKI